MSSTEHSSAGKKDLATTRLSVSSAESSPASKEESSNTSTSNSSESEKHAPRPSLLQRLKAKTEALAKEKDAKEDLDSGCSREEKGMKNSE